MSDGSAGLADLDGPWDHGDFTLSCTRQPRPDLKDRFWRLYESAFGPLRVLAAARQVLTEQEFAEELDNHRVWKYVADDRAGDLLGLTTVTDDITLLPWLSPEYFAHRYPEQWRRQAVFYVGVTLVRPSVRGERIFRETTRHIGRRVAAARGVIGYDICQYNDEHRSLARVTGKVLQTVADFTVSPVDVQTYYVARIS